VTAVNWEWAKTQELLQPACGHLWYGSTLYTRSFSKIEAGSWDTLPWQLFLLVVVVSPLEVVLKLGDEGDLPQYLSELSLLAAL